MFRKLIFVLAAPVALGAQQASTQVTDSLLHPISLAEAVRLARDNNVSNIVAANGVRSANYGVRAARAALFPTLTGTASQQKTFGQSQKLNQENAIIHTVAAWGYSTALSSQLTLFDAGKMFSDIKTQNANLVAAQATQVTTEYGVTLNVKLAYDSILAAKESEAAANAQLEAASLQLATSIAKVNAGAANVSDSLRSVVQMGNAQLALLQAKNTYRTQSAALTHLVGTSYFVTADLADTVAHSVAKIDSAAIMQLALSGPTIRQLEAQVTAASASERSAKTAYLPTVSATFNYSGSGASTIYGFATSPANPYPYTPAVTLSLNYPLFNRFARENSVAAAEISYQNTQAQVKDARLNAEQSIITDIATLRNAEETMRVQQINVAASQEDLRVQQQRYNLGASVLLDVLNSQQALVTARQQLIQARLDYRNALAQIEAVIGRDLP